MKNKPKFDEYIIDEKDKKRAKTSFIIFGSLSIIFIAAAVVLGCLIPRQKDTTELHGEKLRSLIEADSTSYFLSSDNYLVSYDLSNGNEKKTYEPVKAITNKLEADGTIDSLLPNSLQRLSYKYFSSIGGEERFAAIDSNGNWFTFIKEGEELSISDDYYLVESRYSHIGTNWDEVNPVAYSIYTDSDNAFVIKEFDLLNIHQGPVAEKTLWEFDTSASSFGGKTIRPLAYGTGVWDIVIDDKNVYILEDGGLISVSKSMLDYNKNGEQINYFKAASDNYIAYLRGYLKSLDESKKEKLGISDQEIDLMKKNELESYYVKASSSNTIALAKEKAAAELSANNDWCDSYDALKGTFVIPDYYLDDNCQRIVYSGDFNMGGSVYSNALDKFYFANRSDDKIYTIDKNVLVDTSYGDVTLSSLAMPVETIDLGGRKLSGDFCCVRYNHLANSMFVMFANSQTISIVSLDEEKTICTFDANFEIFSIIGNASDSNCVAMRNYKSVDSKGVAENSFVASSYEPARFAMKSVIVGFFVAFLIISVIWILFFLVSFLAHKRRNVMFKTKTIIKDVMKNKFTYIALIPFVAMLILFCYYEAFGSIALSFFDYTAEKPAYIWNNFANYVRIFNEENFWLSVGNMLFFLVFDLILGIVPPLIFGFCLTIMRNKKYSGIIRSAMFIPAIIPGIASMLIWRIGIFGDYGVLNSIVKFFNGQPVQFLANRDISRWSLLLMGFPFVGGYLIFYGGLMNIPSDYHEAAELEGLSVVGRFLKIDVPLIMPQIKYIFVTTFIASAQNYARTYMLKSAGTVTPVENMYVAMKVSGDYGMASAYATLIFIFLLAAVTANFKMQKDQGLGDAL